MVQSRFILNWQISTQYGIATITNNFGRTGGRVKGENVQSLLSLFISTDLGSVPKPTSWPFPSVVQGLDGQSGWEAFERLLAINQVFQAYRDTELPNNFYLHGAGKMMKKNVGCHYQKRLRDKFSNNSKIFEDLPFYRKAVEIGILKKYIKELSPLTIKTDISEIRSHFTFSIIEGKLIYSTW